MILVIVPLVLSKIHFILLVWLFRIDSNSLTGENSKITEDIQPLTWSWSFFDPTEFHGKFPAGLNEHRIPPLVFFSLMEYYLAEGWELAGICLIFQKSVIIKSLKSGWIHPVGETVVFCITCLFKDNASSCCRHSFKGSAL